MKQSTCVRTLLSIGLAVAAGSGFGAPLTLHEIQPVIVAGAPPDSPANRVDPNVALSPFSGIGSLQIVAPNGTFICSATPVSAIHIVTAAHCLDTMGSNGTIDVAPGNVTFNLNFSGSLSNQIAASALAIHPDFTGFANPTINDDIALITLSAPIPAGVPIYPLFGGAVASGGAFTMVGYGLSGDGINGYTIGASFTVKRSGANAADGFFADDEGAPVNEVFYFDFDDPNGVLNFIGGPSLGNTVETQLGGGDSGGPSLVFSGGGWALAGVNTFIASFSGGPAAPLFGSAGGGILIFPYLDWLLAQINQAPEPGVIALLALGALLLSLRRRREPA